jgi:hypothetical protein
VVEERLFTVRELVVFAIVVPAVAKLFDDDSHLRIFPTCPDKVKTVLLGPAQTVVPPSTVPPTEAGVTLIVAAEELTTEQFPLCTTALYDLGAVRLVTVRLAVVLVIIVVVAKLSVEDSHRRIVPTCPDKVRVVLLVGAQTVVPPVTVPPTVAGSTTNAPETAEVTELTEGPQDLLTTT